MIEAKRSLESEQKRLNWKPEVLMKLFRVFLVGKMYPSFTYEGRSAVQDIGL